MHRFCQRMDQFYLNRLQNDHIWPASKWRTKQKLQLSFWHMLHKCFELLGRIDYIGAAAMMSSVIIIIQFYSDSSVVFPKKIHDHFCYFSIKIHPSLSALWDISTNYKVLCSIFFLPQYFLCGSLKNENMDSRWRNTIQNAMDSRVWFIPLIFSLSDWKFCSY